VEQFQFLDIMAGTSPQGLSRSDRGDHEGAIRTLDVALAKAGVVDALAPALKVLDRAEELVAAGRRERDRAQLELEAANRALLADGEIDLSGYGRTLAELAPWISENPAASIGVGEACRQVKMRATMIVFGMVGELYRRLSAHCKDVVTVIGGIPNPPPDVWQVQGRGAAGTVMIRHGREADWAKFVRLSDEWDAIHACGALLRETGQLQTELMFPAGPTDLCTVFLNWEPAVGGENLTLLPGPLRVRRAHDLGWRPGLWTKQDHERYAVEQQNKPKRKLLAALTSGRSGNPPDVGDEFSG
jgi:hypothetical protein